MKAYVIESSYEYEEEDICRSNRFTLIHRALIIPAKRKNIQALGVIPPRFNTLPIRYVAVREFDPDRKMLEWHNFLPHGDYHMPVSQHFEVVEMTTVSDSFVNTALQVLVAEHSFNKYRRIFEESNLLSDLRKTREKT